MVIRVISEIRVRYIINTLFLFSLFEHELHGLHEFSSTALFVRLVRFVFVILSNANAFCVRLAAIRIDKNF